MPGACTIVTADGIAEIPGSLKRMRVDLPDDAGAAPGAVIVTPKLYYVTSRALSWAMQGEKYASARNPNGTIYGAFETADEATSFIDRRGLRMVASVVHK